MDISLKLTPHSSLVIFVQTRKYLKTETKQTAFTADMPYVISKGSRRNFFQDLIGLKKKEENNENNFHWEHATSSNSCREPEKQRAKDNPPLANIQLWWAHLCVPYSNEQYCGPTNHVNSPPASFLFLFFSHAYRSTPLYTNHVNSPPAPFLFLFTRLQV